MGRFFTVYTLVILILGCVVTFGFPQPEVKDPSSNSTKPLTTLHSKKVSSSSSTRPSSASSISQTPHYDDTDMYLEPDGEADQVSHSTQTENTFTPSELEGGSQTFYPSFLYNNPPLGHSRPVFYQQEAAYSQRPNGAYRQQVNYDNVKYNNPFRRENYQAAAVDTSQSLLGSGNFGVIRGGTFYNENDGDQVDQQQYNNGRFNNYNQFFHNNGHGRPAFYFGATNPRPHQHEQFANFRDFADINTPNPAYSQYVVVYINKNGSTVDTAPKKEPKNIIERLAMLDLEVKKSKDESSPPKKLSAAKRKLALQKPEKKGWGKKKTTTTPPSDLYEPLLALS